MIKAWTETAYRKKCYWFIFSILKIVFFEGEVVKKPHGVDTFVGC